MKIVKLKRLNITFLIIDGCCFNNYRNYQSTDAEQAISARIVTLYDELFVTGPTTTANPLREQVLEGRGDL